MIDFQLSLKIWKEKKNLLKLIKNQIEIWWKKQNFVSTFL